MSVNINFLLYNFFMLNPTEIINIDGIQIKSLQTSFDVIS